jgi:hypothetical protein
MHADALQRNEWAPANRHSAASHDRVKRVKELMLSAEQFAAVGAFSRARQEWAVSIRQTSPGVGFGLRVGCKSLNHPAGGEGGIRTPGRGLGPYDGLANRCFRPLSHLSAAWMDLFQSITAAARCRPCATLDFTVMATKLTTHVKAARLSAQAESKGLDQVLARLPRVANENVLVGFDDRYTCFSNSSTVKSISFAIRRNRMGEMSLPA